uniref:Uncharacterized protein n=1 Tax=Sphaerodactylus townsendi TaxID=933632 RepID=A0ACB8GB50_9SAUR
MLLDAVMRSLTLNGEEKHVWTGHHFGSQSKLPALPRFWKSDCCDEDRKLEGTDMAFTRILGITQILGNYR